MCISKADLENRVQEIRRYKAMAEEAANIQHSLENEVIAYCNAALYSRQKKHFIFDSINTITAYSFR